MYERHDLDLSAYVTRRPTLDVDDFDNRPDSEIDFSDIPETTAADWKDAIRNPYMNPDQKLTEAMVDNDVLAWLKSDGPGFRIRINTILRDAMLRAQSKPADSEPVPPAHTLDTQQAA